MAHQKVLQLIERHASEFTWDASAWCDDSFNSKRVFPDFGFKCGSLSFKSSATSMAWMVQHVVADFAATSEHIRKKVTRKDLEKHSEVSGSQGNYQIHMQVLTHCSCSEMPHQKENTLAVPMSRWLRCFTTSLAH